MTRVNRQMTNLVKASFLKRVMILILQLNHCSIVIKNNTNNNNYKNMLYYQMNKKCEQEKTIMKLTHIALTSLHPLTQRSDQINLRQETIMKLLH